MAVLHLSMNNFKDFVSQDELVLVDFWATWCGPCRMLAPVLEELNEKDGIKVGKVDVDENDELASAFRVSSIPTIILFKAGKMVSKTVGYMPIDDLRAWVKQNA